MQTSRSLLPRCIPCPRHLPPNYHLFTIFRRNASTDDKTPLPFKIRKEVSDFVKVKNPSDNAIRKSKRPKAIQRRLIPGGILEGKQRTRKINNVEREDAVVRTVKAKRGARIRTVKSGDDEQGNVIKISKTTPWSITLSGLGIGRDRKERINNTDEGEAKRRNVDQAGPETKAQHSIGLNDWKEWKDIQNEPTATTDNASEKTGFRAASLRSSASTSSRQFKYGTFWSKLRDLSVAKPLQPEEAQAEVQEVDEQEVEEDLKIAKELAGGGVVKETVPKEDSPPQAVMSKEKLLGDKSTSELKVQYTSPPKGRPPPIQILPTPPRQPKISPFDAITAASTPISKPKPKRATDLLTLLFPGSVKPSSSSTTPTRPVSRIPFTPTITNLLSAVSAQEAAITANASETVNLRRQEEQAQRWRRAIRGDVGILVLRKASKNLDFDDFARVAPGVGTKHLSGWSGSGDIVRVIKARDTVTFEASTNYFIVFRNEQAAKAYHDHILDLHNYARTFSPVSGSMSERVAGGPARRLRLDPEVLQGQLEAYCLALPGHDLSIKLVKQPFSPLIRKILDAGGYIGLSDEEKRVSDWEVMLSMDYADLGGLGSYGALSAVRKALVMDGQSKGVLWNIVGKWSGVREVKAGMSKEEYDGEHKTTDSGKPVHRKFVISFPSEDEAVRFVGSWHKKDVGHLMPSVLDMERVVVDAEHI